MREWLVVFTENAVLVIDAMASVIIIVATIEAFIDGLKVIFASKSSHLRRDVWLRYGRWMIAGLTFQLAADIMETSIRTSWQSIAQLGAVAVIRTFLNYFLERDMADVRERERESERREPGPGKA